jgi:hypothetical protein
MLLWGINTKEKQTKKGTGFTSIFQKRKLTVKSAKNGNRTLKHMR